MKRATGIMLLLAGLLPLIGVVGFGLWLWAQHMYTVGLSADARGIAVLTLLILGDASLIGTGIYLLSRSRAASR